MKEPTCCDECKDGKPCPDFPELDVPQRRRAARLMKEAGWITVASNRAFFSVLWMKERPLKPTSRFYSTSGTIPPNLAVEEALRLDGIPLFDRKPTDESSANT